MRLLFRCMSLDNPHSSFGSAAEFQSAGLPYVTSSVANPATPHRYQFAKVTRSITVRNNGTGSSEDLLVGFTHNGIMGNNHFNIPWGEAETFEVRVKQVFVKGLGGNPAYSIFASLTTVDSRYMPLLTGTLQNGDPGWEGVG